MGNICNECAHVKHNKGISNEIVFDCYIRQASNIHTKQIHLFNITKIGGGLTERWRGAGAENGVKRKWREEERA